MIMVFNEVKNLSRYGNRSWDDLKDRVPNRGTILPRRSFRLTILIKTGRFMLQYTCLFHLYMIVHDLFHLKQTFLR